MRSSLAAFWLAGLACAPPTSFNPLTHEAYVWQRAWTEPVREAVEHHDLDGLVPLAAEVSWSNGKATIFRVHLPHPVDAVAVRISAPPPGTDVARAIGPLIAELSASNAGAEIQLDMDLPTARLPEYSRLLRDLREHSDAALVLTALPTWLDSPSFADVARASDGFVLQVHWFDPARPLAPLLQPDAWDATQRAARLGVPFRVALPAYGHRVWLDEGVLVRFASEQSAAPPPGATEHRVMADPVRVDTLLDRWRQTHPAALTGVLWFRLPTRQDRLVWHPATLAAVRHDQPLQAHPTTERLPSGSGAETVCLHNAGNLPWAPAPSIQTAATLGGGKNGWTWSPSRHALLPPVYALPLQPDERRCVGWIRTGNPHASSPASAPAPAPR